jgi:site-specific recombinase XerD
MAVFMTPSITTNQKWRLASVAIHDALTDFILSRQAMQCSPATLRWYGFTASKFVDWLIAQSVNKPDEVTARHVRAYLAELTARGLKDTTLHGHARAVRTLLRFWHGENYIPAPIKFDMPKLTKKRLPVLTADEVGVIVRACENVRDKAIIMLMVDTGLRRSEIVALDWGDIDIMTGLARVKRGKGGKARSVVIGAISRRALLAYRRTLGNVADNAPLIQARNGARLRGTGLLSLFKRLSNKTGLDLTPHALRRTFTILSLRAGMDVLHLQALLGHASLDMVQHYAQMVDDDLLQAHAAHSPIDNLSQLTKGGKA